MSTKRRSLMIAVAVVIISGWASQPAQASDFSQGYFSFYRGWGPNVYSSGQLPVPPYFAIHPPVYYGLHMVRHYGYNPFTCPCDGPVIHYSWPLEATVAEPQEIASMPARVVNHYVTGTDVAAKRIVNPYVMTKLAAD